MRQAAADEKRYAPTGQVQSGQPAGIRQGGRQRCNPPKRTCTGPRRPSTKCRPRSIGPPSARPSTARSSTRRSTSATWSRRARCWSRSSIPNACNWWPAFASRLTRRLQVGQSIGVQIEGLNKQCSGTVSEIVPEAQSASRTFQVKVTGPCPAGHLLGHVRPHPDSLGRRAGAGHSPRGPCERSANWNWSRWSKNGRAARAIRTAAGDVTTTTCDSDSPGLRRASRS